MSLLHASVLAILALGVTVEAALPLPPVLAQPLFRYWRDDVRNNFYTTEWNIYGGGKDNYAFEGVEGLCYKPADGLLSGPVGTVPLYRAWSSKHNNNFFTTDFSAIRNRGGDGYVYEGITCYVYPKPADGTKPLFRYYKEEDKNDFYTTNWKERGVGSGGYNLQEIVGYLLI